MNTHAISGSSASATFQAVRVVAWLAGPIGVAVTHWLMLDVHPIARMCAIIAVMFLWMKAVVVFESILSGKQLPPITRLAAWTLLWPGMRLSNIRCMRHPARVRVGAWAFLGEGTKNVFAGIGVIIFGILTMWWIQPLVGLPMILVGMSLILHYGLFHLVTAGWRFAGYDLGPLFRNPFASRSLHDFWTRRWNLAYTEMCQETVLRATRGMTHRVQVLFVFLFSGLLHEAAISLPVNAGYGLPTLYFALNGLVMTAERRWFNEGGIAARLWAAFWVIAPLPLLFHPWFVKGVVGVSL